MNKKTKFIVGGLTAFSTIDYPDKLACVIFTQGCPWRCNYCHNSTLIPPIQKEAYSHKRILDFLKSRVNLLEAVVISGGEPTFHPGITSFITKIKNLGFLVGLHTAGIYPNKLKNILNHLDWIGLDIKSMEDKYDLITKTKHSARLAFKSLELLLDSKKEFECRTTFHPHLLTEDDMINIATKLSELGVKNYAIQNCRTISCLDEKLKNPKYLDNKYMLSEKTISTIKKLFERFCMR